MASPFSLPSKKKAVGSDEYQKLLDRELKRYKGDRDKAVRAANAAGGFGNSTAQRFMKGSKTDQKEASKKAASRLPDKAPVPTSRPAPLPVEAPLPTPKPAQFPPDLAVSPSRPDNFAPSTPAPPQQGDFAPDLAVSPFRPDNAARSILAPSPQQPPVPMNSAMSMASILRQPPPELQSPLVPMNPAMSSVSKLRMLPPELRKPFSLRR